MGLHGFSRWFLIFSQILISCKAGVWVCTFSISFVDRSQILLHFSIINYYHADEVLIFLFLSNKLSIFLKFHL